MKEKSGISKIVRDYGLNILLVALAYFIFVNTALNSFFTNIYSDSLQGVTTPRQEIVIIKIDDESLTTFGAWPWSRKLIADKLNTIIEAKPAVIGVDILFFESREGDEDLKKVINNSNVPIIFGSKIIDNSILETLYKNSSVNNAYINVNTDSDGKIRKIFPYSQLNDNCYTSFSFEIIKKYFRSNDSACNSKFINLPNGQITLLNDYLNFNYTNSKFTTISFKDIKTSSDLSNLKDKIVLLGSTTLDLRSNLNDNFLDVKGNVIPGIFVHANIINTYLENNFLYPVNNLVIYMLLIIASSLFYYYYRKYKKDFLSSIIYLIFLVALYFTGTLLFEKNIIFPFYSFSIILTLSYFYIILTRIITERSEKRFIRQVFSQYVNPILLDKIVKKPELLKLGGENKEMTIMFSDIRGFTSLSETLSPEDLVHILNRYLDKMGKVIDNHNGTIDKFIGDAIMAFWNAPLTDPNHRLNAIRTSLDMVDGLIEFNNKEHTQFNIGIGINTGKVTVGNLGSTKRFDYTVIGDDVNLASRTEGLTKKYSVNILVIESTIENITVNDIIFRLVDEVIVKGKTVPVKLYEPLRNNDDNKRLKLNYEKGFRLYQEGKYTEAIELFSSLSNDGPSKIMVDRMLNYPKEKYQTGVWIFDDK